MDEPSVLDYVKAKVTFWRKNSLQIPQAKEEATQPESAYNGSGVEVFPYPTPKSNIKHIPQEITLPWRGLAAILVVLVAQRSVESPDRTVSVSVLLYMVAGFFVLWASHSREWQLPGIPDKTQSPFKTYIYRDAFFITLPLTLLAFLAFGSGRFTLLNVFLWLLAIIYFLKTTWLKNTSSTSFTAGFKHFMRQRQWILLISPWTVILLGGLALASFFRFYQLNQVPLEMVSDQAEKLLDVADVLNGGTSIFFPRNTGREALQFYLTAAVIQIFNTGLSFLSLKIGTGIAGLLTLPYIYLLGKEIANRRVGLFALVFTGIAYWPNLITRIGLRFSLYPLFVAPVLYYLIRGLRTSNRNDFILAGLALGLGLHGYTSIRILPFVVVFVIVLFIFHNQSKGTRYQAVFHLILLGLAAFMIFLPLFRYALSNPDLFAYRAFTRLSDWERPLPAPAIQIFLQNLWKSETMFFWSNGGIWVHSIPGRPALDIVSGALFFAGQLLLLARYLRERHWVDLSLLIVIPMLMMPSILSLAFPDENPSLNRSAGAFVPVFIIVGIALDGLLQGIQARLKGGLGIALAIVIGFVLISWSSYHNYDLVFNQYQKTYRLNSWNTSEMGKVIHGFSESIGRLDSAWVVGYPYWVDTRLVGINAGYPQKDYAIWPDQIQATRGIPYAKLFILNPLDTEGLYALQSTYPEGSLQNYQSEIAGKDFFLYLVPPEGNTPILEDDKST